MKHVILIIICLVSIRTYAQTAEHIIVQEKSSDWIRVAAATVTARPAATKASTHKTVRKNRPAAKPKESEFEKTNKQVNRFKKTKDD